MIPIFRDRESAMRYFDTFPWGVCIIAKGDTQIQCKGRAFAEKAIKKLHIK